MAETNLNSLGYGCQTIIQSLRLIYETKTLSDISFKFASSPRITVTAHRLILAMRSKVFEAMLFGPMSTKEQEITLVEENPESFQTLIECIYGFEPEITASSVTGLLYLAEKYWVSDVTERCVTCLTGMLCPETFCQVFELASMYYLPKLKLACISLFEHEPDDCIYSDDFLKLPLTAFKELMSRKTVQDDVLLFKETSTRWALARCLEQGQEPDSETLQSFLLGNWQEEGTKKEHGNIVLNDYDNYTIRKRSQCSSSMSFQIGINSRRIIHFTPSTVENAAFMMDNSSVDLEFITDSAVCLTMSLFQSPVRVQSILISKRQSTACANRSVTTAMTPRMFNNWTLADSCIIFDEPIQCEPGEQIRITFRLFENGIFKSLKITKSVDINGTNVCFLTVPSMLISAYVFNV